MRAPTDLHGLMLCGASSSFSGRLYRDDVVSYEKGYITSFLGRLPTTCVLRATSNLKFHVHIIVSACLDSRGRYQNVLSISLKKYILNIYIFAFIDINLCLFVLIDIGLYLFEYLNIQKYLKWGLIYNLYLFDRSKSELKLFLFVLERLDKNTEIYVSCFYLWYG